MELKYRIQFRNNEIRGSSNRTFMELKLRNKGFQCHMNRCSNRTFMELKYQQDNKNAWKHTVLIVPLWN